MVITPRSAELLSYLQGLGPVGQWVSPKPEWLRADLGINNRTVLMKNVSKLKAKGIIESRRIVGRQQYEYRVLRRLESGIRIGIKSRGRPMGRANGWRVPTGLLQYAGSEVMA
jgi:hypothetical protein